MKNKKTILITGCDSGFGKDAAVKLHRRGHRVLATVKKPESVNFFKKQGIESFVLDVTSDEHRRRILKYDLDVLINNAGTGESGSLAEIDIRKVKENFEVNLFSPIVLTQLVLKKMIKKDRGTIIFVSSLAGRVVTPFLAPYCMTKFSLSAGTEALRSELAMISKNIKAVVVEPGAYHTGFNQVMLAKKYYWMNKNSYFYKKIKKLKNDEKRRFALLEVRSVNSLVKQIIRAAEAKNPRLRYVAPWWQALGVRLMRIFGK